MLLSSDPQCILIADPRAATRNLLTEVLRGAGFFDIVQARDGRELLAQTEEYGPTMVITTSRLPLLSGLEFTRMIRARHLLVPRDLPIIAMTDTPTKLFLDNARDSGVNEILVRPFSAEAVVSRIRAVLYRRRDFLDSTNYVGPCRRRRSSENYTGPLRRFVDPLDGAPGGAVWETESARAVVRLCVQKVSELFSEFTPGDRRKLRAIYNAVRETESTADQMRDVMMAQASRSLGRYIMAIGATGTLERDVVSTHIDALHTLGVLGSAHHIERENLVEGLERIVDKKLRRQAA
jgi:CheY-like chemotaxis protein